MKAFLLSLTLFFAFAASSQYYYKDIVGTKESADMISSYRNNKVTTVVLNTYTINNTPIENLSIQQQFITAQQALRTVTKNDYTGQSVLTTYVDASGRVLKTTDESEGVTNTSVYTYTAGGQLKSITTTRGDTLAATQSDEHQWQYDAANRITKMLRIKNGKDTSTVAFKLDEKGNVIEEQETRRYLKEEPYYYYYDAGNRLTDVVRYNKKAARLLPIYMFEYDATNQLSQRITVPEGSSQYLTWRFAYNNKGLKTKEVVFNKEKEQTGKVEYQYSFSN